MFIESAIFTGGIPMLLGSMAVAAFIMYTAGGWLGRRLAAFWMLWQFFMPVFDPLPMGLLLLSGLVLTETLFMVLARYFGNDTKSGAGKA